MSFSRILTNICSDRLSESRDFYVSLLDFEVSYDSDWYVQLRHPSNKELEFGIILRSHDLIPQEYQTTPSGMYITFVVPDVDLLYEKAIGMGLRIVQEPRDEFYGQRRFLTVDPNGCLIDICSPSNKAER
ncbi:VOC family protein [Pseudanabaena galeata UHCC 0370]|uniref:VOC family protein n=1 Tax=Pseudanabaena galeata UHCC 0370 TaxID=3110310 RepID=A0ABU5TEW8_9CYAN|nr:VOC family protein [Pseudanabaena galeata]MEA5476697.1 VOC family protein [Pseudanabaena galeata UHCC 0370]